MCAFTEDEESQLREMFNFVAPLHKSMDCAFLGGMNYMEYLYIYGWMQTLKIIGSNLGIVEHVHFKKGDWSCAEICVFMDLSNPKHQFHKVIVVGNSSRNYNIFVREIITRLMTKNQKTKIFVHLNMKPNRRILT